MAAMPTSKITAFTDSELAALDLWRVPDVFHEKEPPLHRHNTEETNKASEADAVSVLTVEDIEAMQKLAYDEAFALGKEEGVQQGIPQGIQQGLEEGYAEGFAKGTQQGYDEKIHVLQTQAQAFSELLDALSEPFKKLDEEVEQELVKLAIGIATQIIRREIKMNPGQVVAAAREAISVLPLASQKITIHLHPEDADLVRSVLSLEDVSPSWSVFEDPLITRGGCKIDTEVSHVDATIEHRLAAVIANVLGSEREPDKPL